MAHTPALPGFLQRLPGRWVLVGAAFLGGWLLFVLVWLVARRDDVAAPVPMQPVAAPAAFEPLPRPMPAGDAATPLPPPSDEAPRLVEAAPPAPAPAEPAPLPPSLEENAPAVAAPAQPPVPLPDQSPSPRYPVGALRRGDTGTVVVQVAVDAEGRPVSVEVVERSGSRELDRAAVEAVSRWHFAPARDAAGAAVAGSLSVPIDFKLE
ncbi:energy transducer TonB [Pseudoxanthomonas sp. 10H]|uniref:energy transducer TonB n=1 Tax=Pseudoxanthomonas sp. 10H TaxID=3242729 RepID=UPI003558DB7E